MRATVELISRLVETCYAGAAEGVSLDAAKVDAIQAVFGGQPQASVAVAAPVVTAAGTSEGAKLGWEGRAHGGHLKTTDGRYIELRRTTQDPNEMFKFRTGSAEEIGEHGAEHAFKAHGHGSFLQNLRQRGYKVHMRDEAKVKEFFDGPEAEKESSWDKHFREANSRFNATDLTLRDALVHATDAELAELEAKLVAAEGAAHLNGEAAALEEHVAAVESRIKF